MRYELPDWALASDDAGRTFVRQIRNILLIESDWTQLPDAPVNAQQWANYRESLRDFPSQWTPAETVEFPEQPA